MTRAVMWGLLAVVAAASAVLSFAALRDLAILCSFHERLSFLLPLVVDAGAAAGCLVWLSPKDVTTEARRFARALTFVLLASSVAGNAIVHGLSAYGLRPHWVLVVAVSGVAPAVLGAVVHLSVLVGRDVREPATDGISESTPAPVPAPPVRAEKLSPAVSETKPSRMTETPDKNSAETKARALLAANPGIGRRALMAQTGLSEYEARKMLEQSRAPRNGHKVLEEAR